MSTETPAYTAHQLSHTHKNLSVYFVQNIASGINIAS